MHLEDVIDKLHFIRQRPKKTRQTIYKQTPFFEVVVKDPFSIVYIVSLLHANFLSAISKRTRGRLPLLHLFFSWISTFAMTASSTEIKKERRKSFFEDPFFDASWEEFEKFRKNMMTESQQVWKSMKDSDKDEIHHHASSSMSMMSSSSSMEKKTIPKSNTATAEKVSFKIPPKDEEENTKKMFVTSPTHRTRHPSFGTSSHHGGATATSHHGGATATSHHERATATIHHGGAAAAPTRTTTHFGATSPTYGEGPSSYPTIKPNYSTSYGAASSIKSMVPTSSGYSGGSISSIATPIYGGAGGVSSPTGSSTGDYSSSSSVIKKSPTGGEKEKVTFGEKKFEFEKGGRKDNESSTSFSNRRSTEMRQRRARFFNDWTADVEEFDDNKNPFDDEDNESQNVKIRNDDHVFEITLDIRDYEPDELTVTVGENRVLVVEGKHEDVHVSKNFVRKYTLPPSVDIDEVYSTLSKLERTLIITAPKKDYETQPSHSIRITMKN